MKHPVPCHLDVVVDISLALCRVQPRALRTEKRVRVLGGGVVGGDIGTGIQGLGIGLEHERLRSR